MFVRVLLSYAFIQLIILNGCPGIREVKKTHNIINEGESSVADLPRDATPNDRVKRSFVYKSERMWKLPIPYMILPEGYSSQDKDRIRQAIKIWEAETCVRFKEVSKIGPYEYGVKIFAGKGCASSIGQKKRGGQILSLAPRCLLSLGVTLHELGHTIGFFHEQARIDRNDAIHVNMRNVLPKFRSQFYMVSWGALQTYGYPYDMGSVFQYGPTWFSRDGKPTIEAWDPIMNLVIGQRRYLSFYDIKGANTAYCKDKCPVKLKCANRGYTDPNKCSTCRCPTAITGRLCDQFLKSKGKEKCGYIKQATSPRWHSLNSPFYPSFYPARQLCNWLLTGYTYNYFFIHVISNGFAMKCLRTRCQDFVELRYYHNIALSGPRFCSCHHPRSDILSYGNRVLVLFESKNGGTGGFKLFYRARTCGGCMSSHQSSYRPCYKSTFVQCRRRWKKWKGVCGLWGVWFRCVATILKRILKCEKLHKYCCRPYTLNQEGTSCELN